MTFAPLIFFNLHSRYVMLIRLPHNSHESAYFLFLENYLVLNIGLFTRHLFSVFVVFTMYALFLCKSRIFVFVDYMLKFFLSIFSYFGQCS